MTDRELLELAAKAEGHGVHFDEPSGLSMLDNPFTGILWNPLDNDGDALRLAVKLRLSMHFGEESFLGKREEIVEAMNAPDDEGRCICPMEGLGDDPSAATRRAIVRAAAAIGGA